MKKSLIQSPATAEGKSASKPFSENLILFPRSGSGRRDNLACPSLKPSGDWNLFEHPKAGMVMTCLTSFTTFEVEKGSRGELRVLENPKFVEFSQLFTISNRLQRSHLSCITATSPPLLSSMYPSILFMQMCACNEKASGSQNFMDLNYE